MEASKEKKNLSPLEEFDVVVRALGCRRSAAVLADCIDLIGLQILGRVG